MAGDLRVTQAILAVMEGGERSTHRSGRDGFAATKLAKSRSKSVEALRGVGIVEAASPGSGCDQAARRCPRGTPPACPSLIIIPIRTKSTA